MSPVEHGPFPEGAMQSSPQLTTEEIKSFRVDLDRILTRVQQAPWLKPKEQVEIKLKETRHWLGECLKILGHELPEEFRDKYVGKE